MPGSSDQSRNGNQVTVRVPAERRYLRLMRMNAATFAAEAGFDVEEVADLRIAIDELCALLLDGGDGGSAEIGFTVDDIELRVVGERTAADLPAVAVDDLVRTILLAAVDDHTFGADEQRRWFTATKRRSRS